MNVYRYPAANPNSMIGGPREWLAGMLNDTEPVPTESPAPAKQETSTPQRSGFKNFFQRLQFPFLPSRRERVSPRREVTTSQIEIISSWLADEYIYDPSEYLQKYRLRVFQRMLLQSPDAKAAMMLKQLSVLADGWEIYDSSDEHKEEGEEGKESELLKQSRFVREQLENLNGGMEGVLEHVLSALIYGFSLSEKVYEVIKDGEWEGLLTYKVIRDKPVFDFAIDTEPTGEVTGFIQDQGMEGPVQIPRWKMVYFAYQGTSNNPYGISDLCPAFQHVFAMSVMDESWPASLKRFGMPILLAELTGRKYMAEDEVELEDILKKVKEETGIILKENIKDIRYLEQNSSNQTYTAYQRHQEYRAQKIRLSCLVPDLAISEGIRVGSKALGQVQIKGFVQNVIRQIRHKIEVIVNEEIIKPLVDFNFENVVKYPKFQFGSGEMADNERMANIMTAFIDRGVLDGPDDREWLRGQFDIPNDGRPKKDFVPMRGSQNNSGGANEGQYEKVPSQHGRDEDEID